MFAARCLNARPGPRKVVGIAILTLVSGLAPVITPWLTAPAGATPNTSQLVSVASGGTQGTSTARGNASISAGGRFVAFDSYASNIAGITDGNDASDIFVRDRAGSGSTELISVSTTAGVGNGASADPSMSADGRYVAFSSTASNLVSGDTNSAYDVFVRDRLTGTTERVSVSSSGAEGDQGGFGPRISEDGRYVVFGSDATNLAVGDTNEVTDVFLRDRVAGTTERISVSTAGAQGNGQSGWPTISADGRYVAYYSAAYTLLDGGADTNNRYDVFVRDRVAATTTRVSVHSSGAQATGGFGINGSYLPSMSADGRYIVYFSGTTNLVAGDTNTAPDIFMWDRVTAQTTRVSLGAGGAEANDTSVDPNISRDGRYITYSSVATNLPTVGSDTNQKQDVFLYDRLKNTTELISLTTTGAQGDQASMSRSYTSADGRFVTFFSTATNLVGAGVDLNGFGDQFVRERDPRQAPPVGGSVARSRRGGGSPSMNWPSTQAADGVETATGNFWQTFTDVAVPGRGPSLAFTRTFNSNWAPGLVADGPLGYGWSFNYGMNLNLNDLFRVKLNEENGSQVEFWDDGSGNLTPASPLILATLTESGGTWTLTRRAREIYLFNSSGVLTAIRDLNGHQTNLAYTSGKLTTVTEPAGRTLTIGWTGTRITSVTDTASPARSATFTYDGSGNLTEVVDVGGGHTQYGYDANHRMTTTREPKYFGDTTTSPTPVRTNHYDGSGRLDWQDDPLGRRTTFNYAGAPGTITVTDPQGNVRVDTFTSGLLTSRTLGSGTAQAATWNYGYDPTNLARTLTVDPNAGVTTTIYDSSTGNALMAIDELGRTTVASYNSLRQPLTVRDPMGVTTTYGYDGSGNLTSESTPLVGTANTRATSYTIDATTSRQGDVLSKTDPDGKVWPRTWDSYGNLSTEADPLGNTTRYCYDTVGRNTKAISPKGTAAGNTCATATPTFTTLTSSDAFGDPLVETDPLGEQTVYTFDANRNRTSVTDANGHTTTSVYDPANQLIEQIRPGGGSGSGIEVGLSTSDANAAPASTLVLTRPAGVAADDVMVAGVAVRGSVSVTAPSGWELIRSDANGSSMKLLSYYRIATGTEAASYTWSFSSAKAAAGTITAYSGVDTSDPVDIDSGLANLSDSASIVAPSVTTSGPNERIIGLFAIMKATTITEPAGMTERGEATSSGGGEPPVTIESADTTQAAADATGPKTATAPVADRNTGQLIALKRAAGGAGDIQAVSASSAHNTPPNDTTLVIAKPAGTATGHVLVAGVAVRGTTSVTAPSGWTLIRSDSNGSSMQLNSYYRVAGGSEPSSYTWTLSNTKAAAGVITAYSGVDTTIPVEVVDGLSNTSSATAIVAPSITTTSADTRLVGLFSIMESTTITEPSGMQERGEDVADANGEPPVTIEAADTTQAAAGATGTRTATAASAGRASAQLIALRPAPGGGGGSTTLRYDHNLDGTLLRAYNGANEATNYGYDAQARRTSVTDPLNRTTTYGYDPAGNRTTQQDPGGNCAAIPKTGCTTRTYDAAGQLLSVDYSDSTPDVAMAYDPAGRRTAMTDGTGTSSWTWDSLGRLTSSTNGAAKTVGYTYDLRDNLTVITYPGSTGAVTRTFDNASRLQKVKDWLNNETVFTYDANSFLTAWAYPNGTTATRTPDAANRITAIRHAPTLTPLLPFATFDYDRDSRGRLTAVTSTGVPTDDRTFTYTPIGQLATDTGDPYAYDLADNLTGLPNGAVMSYDAANQIGSLTETPDTTTYGFDSRGNRTTVTPPAGPATTLTYDLANRLTAYGSTGIYTYNGDGLRTSKTVSSVTTQFTWNVAEGQPRILVDGTTNYIHGPGGRPLAQITGSTALYYHHDQAGSTRALTNSSGTVIATYTYNPHGKLVASTGTAANPFRFAGQYTDVDTGLVYVKGRYYDPATGQHLTRGRSGEYAAGGAVTSSEDDDDWWLNESFEDPESEHDQKCRRKWRECQEYLQDSFMDVPFRDMGDEEYWRRMGICNDQLKKCLAGDDEDDEDIPWWMFFIPGRIPEEWYGDSKTGKEALDKIEIRTSCYR